MQNTNVYLDTSRQLVLVSDSPLLEVLKREYGHTILGDQLGRVRLYALLRRHQSNYQRQENAYV